MCCHPEKGLWPDVAQSRVLLSWTGLSKAAASGDLAGSAGKPEPGIMAQVAAPLVQGTVHCPLASVEGRLSYSFPLQCSWVINIIPVVPPLPWTICGTRVGL